MKRKAELIADCEYCPLGWDERGYEGECYDYGCLVNEDKEWCAKTYNQRMEKYKDITKNDCTGYIENITTTTKQDDINELNRLAEIGWAIEKAIASEYVYEELKRYPCDPYPIEIYLGKNDLERITNWAKGEVK